MTPETTSPSEPRSIEMPEPTAAPLVLALAIALVAAGVATSLALSVIGGILFTVGLGIWIGQLRPGRGHLNEPLVAFERRPGPVAALPGGVEHLRSGMPGHRLRLPERVHPISAGIKGGLVGGLVMPLPALAYGQLSGHGIWYPVNLLAGLALPGVEDLTIADLEQYQPTLLGVSISIHIIVSLAFGLIYGVLMPMLPQIAKPLAWGALSMPLLWTAVSFVALGIVNPTVRGQIDWPWFVVSQFVFGVVAAIVFMQFEKLNPMLAGLLGGAAGGLLMPIPAALWGWLTHHGIWYPINLLAAMAMRHAAEPSVADLEQFQSEWFLAALAAHAVLSLSFGLAFAIVPRLPALPAAVSWGGLLMPMLWTAASFGLMGVVNPVLQQRVDWPAFIASQFIFGLVAALVVVRSEEIHIPPAGHGPDRTREFLTD